MRKKAKLKSLSIEYIKSNSFRVIHADGIHGGLSPDLDIHMAIFTERWPFPREIFHAINEDGTLGPEDLTKRKVRKGLVREIDADVIIDVQTAKSIVTWLNEKIMQIDALHASKTSKKLNGNGHKVSSL